ncbi:TPR-containing protein DDB_G0280363 isoform X1 [Stomoxys calcitrans]|uniref:TPR-containing protein DDB_G0280363 isoform X1 n=1 Tax=Stomoxys calcitrans TaxID=35570 RepID=UPI0027E29CD5|nr:TPR-containing protein DDB_G0280363 isoform X1 [Stomoxys calcitrans]
MLTCHQVNSAMGLQATAATKRKHDLSFDAKDTNTYTNCPPPIKASKWSLNNNNYIDAAQEQKVTALINGYKVANHNNNNNNENKSCQLSCSSNNNNTNVSSISLRNGKEVPKSSTSPAMSNTTNTIGANVSVMVAEDNATTPLPPTSSTPVPEDSIAKLEVVANAACEPWSSAPEPVDCISKLQAVAVPSDPWGGISTRSTLATTLLSADELDDDDDDFEDDYEEEESIIPTYCPLRYHTFPATANTTSSLQGQRMSGSFSPASSQSYGSRPNYYSEPFPQQNCSRTGSPPHMRTGPNGFIWTNGPNSPSSFYSSSESSYAPQQQQPQQTIRCAENGKSYLELGCSSPVSNPTLSPILSPTPPFIASGLEARHPPLKRCCDGRGTWCNNNKNCYKDIRLKIRNLSMFKLSRFRQVSEQSLYRSVLICNTLKRIDREIETEAKELHHVTAHAAQQQQHLLQHSLHQQPQYHHHLHSHMQIQSPLPVHTSNGNQQQSLQHHNTQQPMLHPQHQDYMPVLNCGRLGGSVEYHNQQQQTSQNSFHQQQQQQQQPQQHYNSERLLDISQQSFQNVIHKPVTSSAQFSQGNSSSCSGSMTATTTTLHPYDHYPFRESNSGRVTPFPCQSVISTPPPPASSLPSAISSSPPTSTSTLVLSATSGCTTSTTMSSTSNSLMSDTDSGFADDDSTRSINWSSVLSLSSQSALDPLNNNDIFSILPPANPATAVPVSVNSAIPAGESSTSSTSVGISGTFTTVQSPGTTSSNTCSASTTPPSATTTATFTTLSTISSATHSLTSSYVTNMNSNSVSASTWEYGFLDMEFGLGTEFTELAPSCKYSSADDLFKSSLTPVASTRYDNELEQPAHIMVGS